jgi:hypothetical protein
MKINIAVVGNESSGKTSLTNFMRKYPLFEVEECNYNHVNKNNHDYYCFTIDANSDVDKQLDFINTNNISNSFIIVLKTDIIPYERNNQTLLNKRIFYFSKVEFFAEKTVFELLSFIVEEKLASMREELENCKRLLNEWGYYNLCSEEQDTIFCIYYWFLKSDKNTKHLINKCINQNGIFKEELELCTILPFYEIYHLQTESVKTILNKLIQRFFIPKIIPAFKKHYEDFEVLEENE